MTSMTAPLQPADFPTLSASVRDRPDLAVLHVTGDDRREWLNGQLTNDVRHTKAGECVYALAVNVRGKVLAEVWMLDADSRLVLLVPQQSLQALLPSFESQIIMEDVEVTHEPERRVLSIQGPKAAAVVAGLAGVYPCDELGHGGFMVLVPRAEHAACEAALVRAAEREGGGAIDEPSWELARLREGRPRYAIDFDDKNYPQEAGLERRAVSFQKGCYLGQEVICTLESRGRLSRQLVRLQAGALYELESNLDVTDETGQVIGRVTSNARDPQQGCTWALAYVKRAAAVRSSSVRAGEFVFQVDRVLGD